MAARPAPAAAHELVTAFIDGLADETKTLAKAELKELIASAKRDESDFVRLQAENLELKAKASAQRLAEGIRELVVKGLFSVI